MPTDRNSITHLDKRQIKNIFRSICIKKKRIQNEEVSIEAIVGLDVFVFVKLSLILFCVEDEKPSE